MVSLNDAVLDWGSRQATPKTSYDEAKTALINGRTQDEIVAAVENGTLSWNEALLQLATVPTVLSQDAVLWLDAEYSTAGEQSVVNQGSGGSALDAKYGSTTGSDTNDPLLLTHTGENYMYLPGIAGNYLSVPDAAGFTPTTSLSLRGVVALTDWTPASGQFVVGHRGAGGNRSYELVVSNSPAGRLQATLSADGTAEATIQSTVAPTVSDGGILAVRADWTSTPDVTFYTKPTSAATAAADCSSDDGWTQLGSVVMASVPASLFNCTATPTIGSTAATASTLDGKVYAALIKVDGTTVLDVNIPEDVTSSAATSFTATSGQTVTVNRATSGRKTVLVTRPVWLFGTDDYLEVADNALLDFGAAEDFTVLAVVRQWATPSAYASYVGKRASTGAGWLLATNNVTIQAFANIEGTAGSTTRSSPASAAGTLSAYVGVRDTTADTLVAWSNGVAGASTADTTTGSLGNSQPLRVGANGYPTASQFLDGEIVAVAVWRRVLDADEIAAINTYYGTA